MTAYVSTFRGFVGLVGGPAGAAKSGAETFVLGTAMAWSFNVSSNFHNNQVQRATLLGQEIRARIECRALLQ